MSGKVQQATAGQAVTVLVNVGGRKETSVSSNTGGAGGDPGKVGDGGKSKASAAAFISKKLTEENNNNSSKPSWTNVVLKKTDK